MDLDFAVERHRGILLLIVLALFAEMGITEGTVFQRLSRPLYRTVLGILRPAESAVRRLIIVMARDMVVKPRPRRKAPNGLKISGKAKSEGKEKSESRRRASFRLFDPPRRSRRHRIRLRRLEPRIHVMDDVYPGIPWFLRGQPAPAVPVQEPVQDDTVNAIPLFRRIGALLGALRDMRRQAERYVLWRDRPKDERRPCRASPLRIGRPPGFRQKQIHEVDEILAECHYLAQRVQMADTS